MEFDFGDAEGKLLREPSDEQTPESLYERQWALNVLARVQARVAQEYERAGKTRQFEQLRIFVMDDEQSAALPRNCSKARHYGGSSEGYGSPVTPPVPGAVKERDRADRGCA